MSSRWTFPSFPAPRLTVILARPPHSQYRRPKIVWIHALWKRVLHATEMSAFVVCARHLEGKKAQQQRHSKRHHTSRLSMSVLRPSTQRVEAGNGEDTGVTWSSGCMCGKEIITHGTSHLFSTYIRTSLNRLSLRGRLGLFLLLLLLPLFPILIPIHFFLLSRSSQRVTKLTLVSLWTDASLQLRYFSLFSAPATSTRTRARTWLRVANQRATGERGLPVQGEARTCWMTRVLE